MNSHSSAGTDGGALTWGRVLRPTLRVGFLLYQRENPLRPAGLASLFRNVAECLLFTLIGVVTAGEAGGDYSFVGAVLLTLTFYTVVQISDVPLRDKTDGTYFRLVRSGIPGWVYFATRAVPVAIVAILATGASAVAVGLLTSRIDMALDMAPAIPLVLVATASSAALGLAAVAPVIGTRYDSLVYNAAALLITLFSGALIPLSELGPLAALAPLLPLTHAIAGTRAAMTGQEWGLYFLGECLVGVGWTVVALLIYTLMERRARQTGLGSLA